MYTIRYIRRVVVAKRRQDTVQTLTHNFKVKTMSKTKTMPKMTKEEVSVAINAMLQAGWKLVRTEEQDGTTKFVFQLGEVETTLSV